MYIEVFRTHEVKASDGFKFQTIGKLSVYDSNKKKTKLFECDTLERPWLDNKRNVSCIPPAPNNVQTYDWIKLNDSPKFAYQHLWIKNVPNRTHIKLHIANSYNQLHGCIAVGDGFAYLEGDDIIDVINSGKTMKKLMELLPNKGQITIFSDVETSNRVPSIDVASEIVKLEVPILADESLYEQQFLDDYLSDSGLV